MPDPDADGPEGDDAGDPATDGPETYALEFVNEGRRIECAADEYILDAAEEAGIEMQYSCLLGVCTICSARIEGEVDQTEGAALTEQEKRERGLVLTCVAYPRSDLRIWTGEGP